MMQRYEFKTEPHATQVRRADATTIGVRLRWLTGILTIALIVAALPAAAQSTVKKSKPAAATATSPAESAAAPQVAGDPVLTNRDTEMRKAADGDSPVVEKIAAKTQVRVVDRKGKWHQVVTASNAVGWVNMMHLRGESSVAASESGTGFFSGITGALSASSSGGAQKSQGATLGIRGFSAEDLQNAAPNVAALQKARSYRSDTPEAERFAREASLKKTDVLLIDAYGKSIAPKS